MRYLVKHTTSYTYTHDVSVSHHVARLAPRTLARQSCQNSELVIAPVPTLTNYRDDYFGNRTSFFTIEGAHRELVVTAESEVEVTAPEFPEPASTQPWEMVRDQCRNPTGEFPADTGEYVFRSPMVSLAGEFAAYAVPSFGKERAILDAALNLAHRIFEDFKFDPRATSVATPVERVLKERRGVCQDFAHLQIACLRSLGVPARYVSGYLETLPPPGQPKLIGADASHAWVQVFCGDAGWIDVDPTNDQLIGERHITLAWGRDFSDVSPIRGVIVGGGGHRLKVAVDVTPAPDEDAKPADED